MNLPMPKAYIQKRVKEALEIADRQEAFTKELQIILKSSIDEEATRNYRRIIPDAGKFYGVPLPVLKVIASEIGKFIQKEPTKFKSLLKTIWHESSFEAKQIVGKSLEKIGPKNPQYYLDFISTLLPDLDNWAVCDNLAMYGVEPIVYSFPELVLPLSKKWIENKNKWIRRFGVVSLRGYKKIHATHLVFQILDLVMEDEEKDVKKAVSWILREISKINHDEITRYLLKWVKSKPEKNTRWIIKNGIKKLNINDQKRILAFLD